MWRRGGPESRFARSITSSLVLLYCYAVQCRRLKKIAPPVNLVAEPSSHGLHGQQGKHWEEQQGRGEGRVPQQLCYGDMPAAAEFEVGPCACVRGRGLCVLTDLQYSLSLSLSLVESRESSPLVLWFFNSAVSLTPSTNDMWGEAQGRTRVVARSGHFPSLPR